MNYWLAAEFRYITTNRPPKPRKFQFGYSPAKHKLANHSCRSSSSAQTTRAVLSASAILLSSKLRETRFMLRLLSPCWCLHSFHQGVLVLQRLSLHRFAYTPHGKKRITQDFLFNPPIFSGGYKTKRIDFSPSFARFCVSKCSCTTQFSASGTEPVRVLQVLVQLKNPEIQKFELPDASKKLIIFSVTMVCVPSEPNMVRIAVRGRSHCGSQSGSSYWYSALIIMSLVQVVKLEMAKQRCGISSCTRAGCLEDMAYACGGIAHNGSFEE